MKKLKFIACMLAIMLCSVTLAACGKDDKKVTIVSATTNLQEFYYVTDTIDWNNVSVTVNYSNNKSETLTKGEFDIETKDAKSDTKWILATDGLKNETAGNLTAKIYNLTLIIIGNETTYPFTVKVNKTEALEYEIDSFEKPNSIATFETNIAENVNGFKTVENAKYYVGDDNAFDITPNYTLYKKGTNEQSSYKIDLDVSVLLGNTVVGDEYYTYSNGKVDFTDLAIGKEFTIKVKPTYFTTNKDGYDIDEVSFNVTVKDGYNIYAAKDLGMLSIVPENFDYSKYSKEKTSNVFYNETTQSYYSDYTENVWKEFLTTNNYTNIQYIKGAFIHNNIDITKDDLPSKFFITSKESTDEFATGKLRDELYIYNHFMQDDFTFEGNYFTISTKNLPVNGCLGDDGSNIFTNSTKPDDFGHTKLFDFMGYSVASGKNNDNKKDYESNQNTVFAQNINAVGNTNGIIAKSGDVTDAQLYGAAGAIIMFHNYGCKANANNVNISSSMIGWFVDYTDGENNITNPTKSKVQKSTFNNMNIKDCFNSAFYFYGAQGGCEIANSTLARFGGPAIHAVSVHYGNDNSTEQNGTNVKYDETVEIENYVGGTEAWFSIIQGAGGIATTFKGADALFNAYCKTMLKDDKFNLKLLFMDEAYLDADGRCLHGSVNDYNFADATLRGCLSQGAPFIWTNENEKVFINADNRLYYPSLEQPTLKTTPLTGTELNIVYPAFNTAVGIIVEIKRLSTNARLILLDYTRKHYKFKM